MACMGPRTRILGFHDIMKFRIADAAEILIHHARDAGLTSSIFSQLETASPHIHRLK